MGAVEIVIALLGLLEKAPEVGDAVAKIVEAFKRTGELTEQQWAELKLRRQSEQQQDHWQ